MVKKRPPTSGKPPSPPTTNHPPPTAGRKILTSRSKKGRVKQEHRERLLIALLSTGVSVKIAVKTVGCSERTLRRYLDDPAFRRELHKARENLFDRILSMAASAATQAVEVLVSVMNSAKTADAVKVSAARCLLEVAGRYREQGELAGRLLAVEDALAKGAARGDHLLPAA